MTWTEARIKPKTAITITAKYLTIATPCAPASAWFFIFRKGKNFLNKLLNINM
ncbi:MAG: hypothetical protein IJD28_07370 [Deferribacterales bacterium]|nr:hypothetical protein [Deferribacterales bacterium]